MNVKKATNRNRAKNNILTPETAKQLRDDWKNGLSYQQLADKYSIYYETARLCATGQTWKHI
jgi:hypothetical protein